MRAIGFLGSQSWGQESTWVTQKMLTSQIFSGMSHKRPLSCLKAWCMIFRNSTVLQPPDIWRPNILFQQLHPKSASNSCYTSIVLSKLGLSKWAKSRSIKSINHLYSVHVDAQILRGSALGSLQNAPTSIVKSLELLVVTISLVWKSGAHPGHKKWPSQIKRRSLPRTSKRWLNMIEQTALLVAWILISASSRSDCAMKNVTSSCWQYFRPYFELIMRIHQSYINF